jgi:hypothetical protein
MVARCTSFAVETRFIGSNLERRVPGPKPSTRKKKELLKIWIPHRCESV